MTPRQAEKEAQRQALLFEEQCKNGLAGDASRITLAEFVPVYLEQKQQTLSPMVLEMYCRVIDQKILPALGHHKIQDLRPVHVQAFIQQLCSIDKRNRDGSDSEEKLSAASVKRYLTVLQSMLKLAVKRRIISENPARRNCWTFRKPLPRRSTFSPNKRQPLCWRLWSKNRCNFKC